MIWQNPWAWLGLGTLALPVLIHLLGRGRARVLRFPTLQFVAPSRPTPLERKRIHDAWLLVVRVAILAAAVMALAQPTLSTAGRRRAANALVSRVVLLDTSASVVHGSRAVADSLRALARERVADGRSSTVIETAAPNAMLRGASQWLERQPGKRELVIISDFQLGTVDSAEIAALPREIGIDLVRVGAATTGGIELRGHTGDADIVVRANRTANGIDADWQRGALADGAAPNIELLADASDAPAMDAARRAAAIIPTLGTVDTSRRIAIVFPSSPRRSDAAARASSPLEAWMVAVVAHLTSDSMLVAAAAASTAAVPPTANGVVVARDAHGAPSVVGASDGNRLLVFAGVPPSDVTAAVLLRSITQALSPAPATTELEPERLSDAALASLRRPAADASPDRLATEQDDSDGRWLWIVALALLALEAWMRRARTTALATTTTHDLAA